MPVRATRCVCERVCITKSASRARDRRLNLDQVVSCLEIINEALHRARGGGEQGELCALDSQGHCFVAAQTQQNILRLWQEVIIGQQVAADGLTSGLRTARPEFAFGNRVGAPTGGSDNKIALNASS